MQHFANRKTDRRISIVYTFPIAIINEGRETNKANVTYLNNIKNHILIKTIQYAFCHSIVTPGSMDK